MTRDPHPRFDANSTLDALALLWGLVGIGLWRLGGWLLAVPDDDVFEGEEE